ncbi:MAG: helix-turn-helix domain-containing protein [Ruminococcaceae bacterium]|nr:helix-turn-helix domain-containing protein [Oscillospiraceae bacterium]
MNIGTNIYTLRKEKKITQAQLAEKLGVSEQSVSKWENNQCAPDVSLFPIMAEFFGVSIDRLFGYHMNSYADEVKAILKAADDSMDTYKEIEILGEGLKKYPNSPELKTALSFSLSMVNRISDSETERKEAVEKAIKLCMEVVDTCGDIKEVDNALNMLVRIYGEIGEHAKALDAIEKISAENYFFRIVGTATTYAYQHNDSALIQFTEQNLWHCWLAMDLILQVLTSRLSETGRYSEAAVFGKLHLSLLSVFDDGCADFYKAHKFFAALTLAHSYRKLDDKPNCLEAIRQLVCFGEQIKEPKEHDDFHVTSRNPLYFSDMNDSDAMEEFLFNFDYSFLLSPFDVFFGNDEAYQALRKNTAE